MKNLDKLQVRVLRGVQLPPKQEAAPFAPSKRLTSKSATFYKGLKIVRRID
jgi:hypothetical protein